MPMRDMRIAEANISGLRNMKPEIFASAYCDVYNRLTKLIPFIKHSEIKWNSIYEREIFFRIFYHKNIS